MIKIRSQHRISSKIVAQDPAYYLRSVKDNILHKVSRELREPLEGEFRLNRFKTSMSDDEMEISVTLFILKDHHVKLLHETLGDDKYREFLFKCEALDQELRDKEYSNKLDIISKLEKGEEIDIAANGLNIKREND